MSVAQTIVEETVGIEIGTSTIYGTLTIPDHAWGAVIFTQGSGCSRRNLRNVFVADAMHDLGLATLLLDLLTPAEERVDAFTARHRFDVGLLTDRMLGATDWLVTNCSHYDFRIGYFAASTGAAAALNASAESAAVSAVVSRGGRPDLAGAALPRVNAATLLIVGGLDQSVIDSNRTAYEQLRRAYRRELTVIPEATHLFEEKGALQIVAKLSGQWFVRYLGAAVTRCREHQATRSTGQAVQSLPR